MGSKIVEEMPLLASKAADALQQGASKTSHSLYNRLSRLGHAQVPPRLQGVLLVAASAFTFSLLSALIKFASYSMSSMETVFWRSSVALALNYGAVKLYDVDLRVKRKFWGALATRCLVGSIAMSLSFYAMQKMVLADASVLIFTSPVMTFFLGALVLKEKIDPINLGFALFSFVGVVCVSRPTFIFGASSSDDDKDNSAFYVMCTLLAAAGQAVVYVSMRRLQELHFMIVINYFLLTATFVSAFSLIFIQQSFTIFFSLSTLLAVIMTGVLGFVGQLFMTRGFQLEKAGVASVMRYLDVAFVFVWDITLLHERINHWSVLGAVIICGCAIMIAVRRMNHH